MSIQPEKIKLRLLDSTISDLLMCVRGRLVEVNVSKKRHHDENHSDVVLDFEPIAHSISDYEAIKVVGNREEAMVPFFNHMTFHDKIKNLVGFTLTTVVRAAGQSEVSLMYFSRELADKGPAEQLMTLDEQQEFLKLAKKYCKVPSINDAIECQALFSFIHRLVDKQLAKQAEFPADGSTD